MESEAAEVVKEEFTEDEYCRPPASPRQPCGLARPEHRAAGGREVGIGGELVRMCGLTLVGERPAGAGGSSETLPGRATGTCHHRPEPSSWKSPSLALLPG